MYGKIMIAVLFLIACSIPAMAQDQNTLPHPVTGLYPYPAPPVSPLFPEVRTYCPISLPLPVPFTPTANAQQAFIQQAMMAPDFNPERFYSCAWVGCGSAAVISWLFGGPAGFAAGCTGVMLGCAANAAGLGQDQIPPELRGQ